MARAADEFDFIYRPICPLAFESFLLLWYLRYILILFNSYTALK